MGLENNRIVKKFAALRAAGKQTLLPFITAGYPNLETTAAVLRELDGAGVGVCELGIPFTDPVADGPVIQASFTAALAAGVTTRGIFDVVRQFRRAGGELPLAAMVSYSIIFRHGVETFVNEAAEAGLDGLIVPDLPLDESAELERFAAGGGLALVLLIAPTTPAERRLEIARHSRGFIYYISVAGITGERTALPEQTLAAVAELRRHTDTPVCVGFGISNATTVREVWRAADGAIVGSAIVKRMEEHAGATPQEIAGVVGKFVRELMA
jgi:tryptophan synthase alpha chain